MSSHNPFDQPLNNRQYETARRWWLGNLKFVWIFIVLIAAIVLLDANRLMETSAMVVVMLVLSILGLVDSVQTSINYKNEMIRARPDLFSRRKS
ncbi:hypothetical protein GF380_01885 [Candidatus Uhrbacteria bacterium]|nr:hypothetical protein [Candidatus Uhrbacteria bacterium]MBD3283991.1 hypothetical protein [Candidatus Uhrbacteria bacterium]